MELEKLENVVGLKFQFATTKDFSGVASGEPQSEEDQDAPFRKIFVINKYNLLVVCGGHSLWFYNVTQEMVEPTGFVRYGDEGDSDKDAEGIQKHLLFNLEMPEMIVNVKQPYESIAEEILLIETVGHVFVYEVLSYMYLFIYSKTNVMGNVWDSTVSRKLLYDMLDEDSLVVVYGNVVDVVVFDEEKIAADSPPPPPRYNRRYKIKEMNGNEYVKSMSNVDGGKLVLITSSDNIYLVASDPHGAGGMGENTPHANNKFGRKGDPVLKLYKLRLKLKGKVDLEFGEQSYISCQLYEGRVAVAVLVDGMDLLVVTAKMPSLKGEVVEQTQWALVEEGEWLKSSGEWQLKIEGYCFNELYLSFDDAYDGRKLPELDVYYKYVREWELLVVYSNRSTSTLLISGNKKLIEYNMEHNRPEGEANSQHSHTSGGKQKIIVPPEGYGLESVEFDDFVVGVHVYTNYGGEVYRKNCLADTPLLRRPAVAAVEQSSGQVAFFYVDQWALTADNKEQEVLPRLGEGEDYRSHQLLLLNNYFNPRSEATGSDLSELSSQDASFSDGSEQPGYELDEDQRLIDVYYSAGSKVYADDPKLFKLFESLANVMVNFSNSLKAMEEADQTEPNPQEKDNALINSLIDSGFGSFSISNYAKGGQSPEQQPSDHITKFLKDMDAAVERQDKTKKKLGEYAVVVEKLLAIQANIESNLRNTAKFSTKLREEGLGQGKGQAAPNTALANSINMINRIVNSAPNGKFGRPLLSVEEIGDAEDVLEYTYAALNKLNVKLNSLTSRVENLFRERLAASMGNAGTRAHSGVRGGMQYSEFPNKTGYIITPVGFAPPSTGGELELLENKLRKTVDAVNKKWSEQPPVQIPRSQPPLKMVYKNYAKVAPSELHGGVGDGAGTPQSGDGGLGLQGLVPQGFHAVPDVFTPGREVSSPPEEVLDASSSASDMNLGEAPASPPPQTPVDKVEPQQPTTEPTTQPSTQPSLFGPAPPEAQPSFFNLTSKLETLTPSTTVLTSNILGTGLSGQPAKDDQSIFSKYNTNKSLVDIVFNKNSFLGAAGSAPTQQQGFFPQPGAGGFGFPQQPPASQPMQQTNSFFTLPAPGATQTPTFPGAVATQPAAAAGGGADIWTSSRRSNPLD